MRCGERAAGKGDVLGDTRAWGGHEKDDWLFEARREEFSDWTPRLAEDEVNSWTPKLVRY